MISFGKPKAATGAAEAANYRAAQSIEQWTGAALPEGYGHQHIIVLESECTVPGCPPLETIIAITRETETIPEKFKLLMPMVEVSEQQVIEAVAAFLRDGSNMAHHGRGADQAAK